MKNLFVLSTIFLISVLTTLFQVPVLRTQTVRVPSPQVIVFQKKTGRFLGNFRR